MILKRLPRIRDGAARNCPLLMQQKLCGMSHMLFIFKQWEGRVKREILDETLKL